MKSNTRRLINFSLLALAISFSGATYAQEKIVDVVYLNNGSIIYGSIIEMTLNESVKIKTADGSIFVYQMDQIQKITKEKSNEQKPKEDLSIQFEINRMQNRKNVGLIGMTSAFALTLAGDLAAGEPFYVGSAIPLIGPAIAIAEIPVGDSDATRDIILYCISGIAQNTFFLTYLSGRKNEKLLKQRYGLSIQPSFHNRGFSLSYNF